MVRFSLGVSCPLAYTEPRSSTPLCVYRVSGEQGGSYAFLAVAGAAHTRAGELGPGFFLAA